MPDIKLKRVGFLLAIMIATIVTVGVSYPTSSTPTIYASAASGAEAVPDADQKTLTRSSAYYTLRRDMRRCASPLCGGYFVSRVNQPRTRCANGREMDQCYVAEIDWKGQPAVEGGGGRGDVGMLVKGELSEKTLQRFGKLGFLQVSESWRAASSNPPAGTFYRLRDRGIRCITHPCATHQEIKLNSTFERNIAGVEFEAVKASDDLLSQAYSSLTGSEGIIVAGTDSPVSGPAGRSYSLKVTQFYLRAAPANANATETKKPPAKGCIKTGCSRVICADEEMMSTCEWRPEYACYTTARCERQTDGKCGFTKTPELTECLATKR